jgi:hypothetical protein
MTIYIATAGEYSDYHICSVFTDKQQCLLYCATHDCELEEYEADEVKLDTTKEVRTEWYAWFDWDGVFISLYEFGYCFDNPPKINFNIRDSSYCLKATLPIGTSNNKAKKILCDMFAKEKSQAMEKGRQLWEAARR